MIEIFNQIRDECPICKGRFGIFYLPHAEDDQERSKAFKLFQIVRCKITGIKKPRSYKELKCYFGSCRYIASLNLNDNINTVEKLDYLTKVQEGFVSDTVYDDKAKRIYWIPRSLSYKNCDQPRAHRFIAAALENHATLVNKSVDDYVSFLKTLS